MIKKIVLFVITVLVVSCSASQPIVYITKLTDKKTNTVVKKSVRKPVLHNTVATRKSVINNKTTTHNSSISTVVQKSEVAKEDIKSLKVESVTPKTEILEATTRVKVTQAIVLDYISLYKDIAKNNMTQYGIPSSIILGQGILESGAGTGPLSAMANNHFGIKCHDEWTGASVKYDDDAAQECFRKYVQPSDSYVDHALFLTSRSWYASLFKLKKDDYKAWARGLKAAGYATDPKYSDKLIAIIERYQLCKYDCEVLGTTYVPVISGKVAVKNEMPSVKTEAMTIQSDTASIKKEEVFIKKEAVSLNSDLYQVCHGDTLYSISKKFNIPIADLKRKNDIEDNILSIGQNLKIK